MKDLGKQHDTSFITKSRFIHEDSEPCLFDQLIALWLKSQEVCISVAFLSVRMLNIVIAHLRNAEKPVPVRFLTGTMNGFNDPRVLKSLQVHFGADNVRIYQPNRIDASEISGFHVKSYLFMTGDNVWTIVIGSSNLTAAALLGVAENSRGSNAEWNLLIESSCLEKDSVVGDVLARFEQYWKVDSCSLTDKILEEYREKWLEREKSRAKETQALTLDIIKPEPRPIQRQALDRLSDFRRDGLKRAVIIGATGIGKTLISAFDVAASGACRVLYVAHRETLLQQAADAYHRLLGKNWKYYQVGGEQGTVVLDELINSKDDGNQAVVVFAMIQTLKNPEVYLKFSNGYFDYLVIDEFHHASAPSYQNVLEYFKPKFLLGLTATPERLDGRDVLELCDYNVALEMRLFDAVEQGSLSPFLYFAIYDETDYEKICWTGYGYDELELEYVLSNDTRTELIANTLGEHLPAFGKVKGISFCSNVGHARYMAQNLTKHGFNAACILGTTSQDERAELLKRLADEDDPLNLLCAVDVLSEGIDVPALTHILLLRPTLSFTVFLQQMGRGLRLHPRKDFLVVLDFVGNYRNNYVAPLVLTGQFGEEQASFINKTLQFKAPKGCYIHPDTEVKRIWQETLKTQFMRLNLKDRLKQLYEEIWDGFREERSPCMMDFFGHPLCPDPTKFTKAFDNWLRVKAYCGGLLDEERAWLDTPAEAFLMHIEKELSAVRSYKMVVLMSLLTKSDGQSTWTVEEIAQWFKAYYLENPLRRKDYDDLARSPFPENYPLASVISHIKKMPLKYLSNRSDKFFILEKNSFSLKPVIQDYWQQVLFRESVLDRVHFALYRYWLQKYNTTEPLSELRS